MSSDVTEPPTIEAEDLLSVPDDHFTTDSVAIVTGGASGIGRATAIALAHNGLTVVSTDIDTEGLTATEERAAELDVEGEIESVECDLAEEADIEAVVAAAAERGDVRYVANIAGLQHIAPVHEFPTEKYDLMLDVMLRAPFLLAKHVIPHIQDTDDGVGAIGNMASVHAHVATQDKVAYHSAKFGLRGLTAAIAAESEGGLRAFTVSTGYVKTPLVTDQIPDTAAERDISEQAVVEEVMLGESRVKEMMTPAEVANLFTLGFSSHARHLNGGDLLWDGGHIHTYR